MKGSLTHATDARQTTEWGNFLRQIGWQIESIDGIYIFIKRVPFLNSSTIKIQHPHGPIPFEKIHRVAREYNALFVVIEPTSVQFDEKAFLKNGYRVSKLRFAHSATILIDLRVPFEALWKSFSENARRNIKKAEKQLILKVEPLNSEQQILKFYSLYTRLGNTKKFYVPSYHEVRAKMRAFQNTSYLLWALEKEHNEPVAVLWVGYFDTVLVYFHPGNTKRGYELLANYLLVWEALKLGKKLGLTVFDFETAYDPRYPWENKQWKGYTEFKRKFGGEFIQYPSSFIKFYNPIFKYFYLFATMLSK